mmetsp:Transcript_6882/g.12159  ORF Transcript_6882/g.12159 Transcript_6882/m.12159 type:complete len:785 (-) Transcript_6882:46-2400(-)
MVATLLDPLAGTDAAAEALSDVKELEVVNPEDESDSVHDMLCAAARSGDANVAVTSLGAGASVEKADFWGLPPLHIASFQGHAEVTRILLDHRAAVNSVSENGQTALHLATSEGQVEVVQLLVQQGADVLSKTRHGLLPLELAKARGQSSACEGVITEELVRQWQEADKEVQRLRMQLQSAEAIRSKILAASQVLQTELPLSESEVEAEETLLEDDVDSRDGGIFQEESVELAESAESANETQPGKRQKPKSKKTEKSEKPGAPKKKLPQRPAGKKDGNVVDSYWRAIGQVVQDASSQANSALRYARLRYKPEQMEMPFSHKGECSSTALPDVDPGDAVLLRDYKMLLQRIEDSKARRQIEGIGSLESATASETKLEATLRALVRRLRKYNTWDWSKVEVRHRGRHRNAQQGKKPEKGDVKPDADDAKDASAKQYGVFVTDGDKEGTIVFRAGDVVGPLGGVLRRKARYEKARFGGHAETGMQGYLPLPDPYVYDLKLRAVTADLCTEALVLDMASGQSQNRLRHLADVRLDPLELGQLRQILQDSNESLKDAEQTQMPGAVTQVSWASFGMSASIAQGFFSTSGGLSVSQRQQMPRPQSRPRAAQARPTPAEMGRTAPPGAANFHKFAQDLRIGTAGSGASRGSSNTKPQSSEARRAKEKAPPESLEPIVLPSVRLVEVECDGWPHVFAVARQDIRAGEELTVDYGDVYWAAKRAGLLRTLSMGRLGHELLLGVESGDPVSQLVSQVDATLRQAASEARSRSESPCTHRSRSPMPRPALAKPS